jgi:hypothetical protein
MNELMPPARASLPALPYGELVVPLLVAQEGERAAKRYLEFFAAIPATPTPAAPMRASPANSSAVRAVWPSAGHHRAGACGRLHRAAAPDRPAASVRRTSCPAGAAQRQAAAGHHPNALRLVRGRPWCRTIRPLPWLCCKDRQDERSKPSPVWVQAMRTEIGRPNSNIRFRAWTATSTSVARR